jgi:hypothetical protein
MSPTRRRRSHRFDQVDRRRTAKVVAAAAVLTVVSGTAILTRAASAESTASAGARVAACAPDTSTTAAGAGTQSPPSQPLSPGAAWLKKRGELTDRHGVHQIWGDGQVPSFGVQSASASTNPGCTDRATKVTPTKVTGAADPSPADSSVASPADSSVASPGDSPVASPGDSPVASPGDSPADSPAPSPGDSPADSPAPSPGDSPADSPAPSPGDSPTDSPAPSPTDSPTASPPPSVPPVLQILGNTCEGTSLAAHTGFQDGNRCVSTEFGEVGTADKNPSLLITSAPRSVLVNQFFDITVSTRNLVRDRFLKAADGGYYKESSFLTAEGLVRGHFHTACRMLAATNEAPDPAPVPAFFVATEDGKGGADADTVTIRVLGLPQAGIAQCAAWAGDGSHRIPMMQRANQIPAFDSVRITVN